MAEHQITCHRARLSHQFLFVNRVLEGRCSGGVWIAALVLALVLHFSGSDSKIFKTRDGKIPGT